MTNTETVAWCGETIYGIIIEYNGTWFIIKCNRCKKNHKVRGKPNRRANPELKSL